MSDDAQFDAFLKGEGELSRRLQALPQDEPSAALDAAILARVRRDLAPQARPAAANDPAPQPATPHLAPPFGYRWRVPVGIAATLLAGVFANQAFQMHAKQEEAPMAELVQPSAVAVSPVEERPPAPASGAPAAAPMTDSARAPMAAPPPPPEKEDMPAPRAPRAAAKPQSAPPAPPPSPAPAPAPAPVADAAPAAAAPAPAMNGLIAQEAAARSQAAAGLAAEADKRKAVAAMERYQAVTVTGSRNKLADSKSWLAEIERLLKDGKNEDALREWQRFREAYPREKVAPELEARLDALEK